MKTTIVVVVVVVARKKLMSNLSFLFGKLHIASLVAVYSNSNSLHRAIFLNLGGEISRYCFFFFALGNFVADVKLSTLN